MRVWCLLPLVACTGAGDSRLDQLLITHGPDPTPQPRPTGRADRPRDDRDRDLDRKLREAAARPVTDANAPAEATALASVLGTRPAPFGPLAKLDGDATRTQVLAAVPGAQPDGPLVWVPTGIDGVAVELSFRPDERLEEIVYHVPLAARPQLVTAWGPPIHETGLWLEPSGRWRASLGEDPVNGKIELAIRPYRPFTDHLTDEAIGVRPPLLGQPVTDVAARFGARLTPLDEPGLLGEVVLSATELCAEPTLLVVGQSEAGIVDRVVLYQCYDDWEPQRRAALATMERAWGRATPTRTAEDRLVFAWSRLGRRIVAEDAPSGHAGGAIWQITIR